MSNPLAVIFQTALLGLKSNWKDENLLQQKTFLFRNLLKKGYSKKRIRVISSFIKTYVSFSKPEYNRKFDETTTVISKNTDNMGIIETIQHINQELEAKGKAEGRLEGATKAKIEAEKQQLIHQVQRIYKALQKKVAVSTISLIEDVPTQFVKDFKQQITKEALQKLTQDTTKLYRQLKIDTSKKMKQQRLVKLWLKHQFSDTAIAEFLKVSINFVAKIRQQEIKS